MLNCQLGISEIWGNRMPSIWSLRPETDKAGLRIGLENVMEPGKGMGRTWWFTRFAPNKVDGFERSIKYGFSHLIVLDVLWLLVFVLVKMMVASWKSLLSAGSIDYARSGTFARTNSSGHVCFGGCKCPCHLVKMVGRSWTGPPLLGNVQEGHLLCGSSRIFVAADLA